MAADGTTARIPDSRALRQTLLRTASTAASSSRHNRATVADASRDRRRACLRPTTALRGTVSGVHSRSLPFPALSRSALGFSATRWARRMVPTDCRWLAFMVPYAAATVAIAESTLGWAGRDIPIATRVRSNARAGAQSAAAMGAPSATTAGAHCTAGAGAQSAVVTCSSSAAVPAAWDGVWSAPTPPELCHTVPVTGPTRAPAAGAVG